MIASPTPKRKPKHKMFQVTGTCKISCSLVKKPDNMIKKSSLHLHLPFILETYTMIVSNALYTMPHA